MELNSKKLERTSRLIYFTISTILCFFLVLLSNRIIDDIDRLTESPMQDQFENKAVRKELDKKMEMVSIEIDNLNNKKALIEKVNTLDETLKSDEAVSFLKGLIAEWNTVGHVPFKEKDKVYKEFHEAIDKQFDRLKVGQSDRKMQSFRSNINDMSTGERGKSKLYGERERLMRQFDRLKSEVQTYENNIGFLSISSKGGSGLVKEMERKIENLKEEMALTVKKIDAIDENLE